MCNKSSRSALKHERGFSGKGRSTGKGGYWKKFTAVEITPGRLARSRLLRLAVYARHPICTVTHRGELLTGHYHPVVAVDVRPCS